MINFRLERISKNKFRFFVIPDPGAVDKKTVKSIVLKETCLVWMGGRSTEGYAIVGRRYVHPAFYRKYSGKIPEGLELDHLCRNRSCVNPRHLEPVSRAENCRRGDRTKLTYSDVSQIRKLRNSGATITSIASRFGIHHSHVSRISSGKVWR